MTKPTLSPLNRERGDKRWDWTANPVMSGKQAQVCSYIKCGKIFSEPIELTVRAEGSLQTYIACPHCFSRLSDSDNLKKRLTEAILSASAKAEKEPVKDIEGDKLAGCAHFLGYLKTRQKDSSIPDECLTCSRILKCM